MTQNDLELKILLLLDTAPNTTSLILYYKTLRYILDSKEEKNWNVMETLKKFNILYLIFHVP